MTKDKKSIRNWMLDVNENVSVGDFNNITDEKLGIFPGQFEGDSELFNINENAQPLKKIEFKAEEYDFFYKGFGYFYGITVNKTEIIASVCSDGMLLPLTEGAGGYVFKKGNGEIVFEAGKVKDFSIAEKDGYKRVTVNYNSSGKYTCAVNVSNTYTFKERCFCVDADIYCIGLEDGIKLTRFERNYLNDFNKAVRKVSFDWQYPENGDFEYKDVDALVFAEEYDDTTFITAVRDENSLKRFIIRQIYSDKFPVYPEIGDEIKYSCHIDYAIVKKEPKDKYKGLFLTRNFDFAAGVAAVNETDNSTMFMGKDLHINLNVTNISDGDISFTSKYEILDYFGNRVLSETSYTNILKRGEEANHNIKHTLDKYGMYFLNFYVVTESGEHKETYPFAMIEEYAFKNRDGSPFGICATHVETDGEARTAARICGKIGLSNTRDGYSNDVKKLHKFLKENGVNRYTRGMGHWAQDKAAAERFVKNLDENCREYFEDEDCAYHLLANEVDGPVKANYEKSKKLLLEKYIPYTYKPVYEFISKNYPEILKKTIWQSNCHGTTEWLEAFYETGMWDNSEIIDIHSYSSPSGPDKVFSNMRESMHANTFSNEYAMDRWKRIQKRYGKKRMIVGETGYPAAPYIGNRCEVDPRTVADFNVRIAMFMLEAGAEDIIYYCIFDRTSYFIGSSPWNEMYFGACYNYDYYGVFQPKPWAAAYANLTRRLDGVQKVTYFDKYEESEFGDLRAFKVETEENEFAVIWSNKYKQPNTTAIGRINNVERIPMSLWENRWIETDEREFDAVGDTVTVVDVMGNSEEIKAVNGKVTLNISGSPVYVYGIM